MCDSKDTIDLVIKALGLISIIIAIGNYKKNSKLERAKWLNGLYEKFYEEGLYKDIRRWLDYDTPELIKLKSRLAIANNESEVDLDEEEKLVNYLNFFEFIAALYEMNQISIKEVDNAFGYYIKLLHKHTEIKQFINENGFKNLPRLIRRVESVRFK